ncbi:hypothetical protein BCR42DRAFT_494308 [Absidia repens]|uniref:Uncharacterized protein n=1 Tax=Absidia repens TaxID=90262 RepID=A0A1X2I709_9FUNG|nr:hypothetical protein BCR42DRAFT_494308 [Absidia repens]
MRLFILIIALLSVVFASPIDSGFTNLAIPKGTLVARDVITTEGRNLNHSGGIEARAPRKCQSVWYLTECYNVYCPCGWYYKKDCSDSYCYDQDNVGCHARCPKNADLQCSTCYEN